LESKKDLKKIFPCLIKELEGSENKVKIDSIRKNPGEIDSETVLDAEVVESEPEGGPLESDEASLVEPDKFRDYNPTVVDFIRRCDTAAQAEEIVIYLCKKGELTEDSACQIRAQLNKNGVRSFGPKKEEDYYFKHNGSC
jgi:hypothetical protein